MLKISSCALLIPLCLTACAAPAPVAVSCPPPPPAPQVLTAPASVGPSLSERYDNLMQDFRGSLAKAMLPESTSTVPAIGLKGK